MGYRDPMYRMQLSSKAAVGDLLLFLEDNPGACEAIVEWISQRNIIEFREALEAITDTTNLDPEDE